MVERNKGILFLISKLPVIKIVSYLKFQDLISMNNIMIYITF